MDETLKSKAELFADDPNRFVDSRDLMIAIIRTPDGPAILCNPKDSIEARHAIVACAMELTKKIIVMEAKSNPIIQKPNGSFLHGIANRVLKHKR